MDSAQMVGLRLMLDNTSFQHLAFLLANQQPLPLSRVGVLETLNLIEALLLADRICVPSYENSTTYEEGERLSMALREVLSNDGTPLLQMFPVGQDVVGQTAVQTVSELLDRDELSPARIGSTISADGGLPRTGKDITQRFWNTAFSRRMTDRDLEEYAAVFLADNGADGALAHALVAHSSARECVLKLLRDGPVDSGFWRRLLVLFRARDNAQMAEHMRLRYAPGTARQSVLKMSHSRAMDRLWSALQPHVIEIRRELGQPSDQLLDPRETAGRFPFLGLAVLNRLPARRENRLEAILRLRDDKGIRELRERIAKSDHRWEWDPTGALNSVQAEHQRLRLAVTKRLRMASERYRPMNLPDGLDKASLVKFGTRWIAEKLPLTPAWTYGRRPATAVLIRCAAVAAAEPSVEDAVRRFVRPPRDIGV